MRTSAIVLALLLSVVPLHAQSSNWNRLESLPEGTELIVDTGRSFRCTLTFIDDEGMECAQRFAVFHMTHLVRIHRAHVASVSLARTNGIVTLSSLVGAAAGASALAAKNDTPANRPIAAVEGAVIGGFGGYVAGHIIRLIPGRTIYVRP